VIAATFHFPPSEIWAMDLDELAFWVKRAKWVNDGRR
jgi:hypothetical protein